MESRLLIMEFGVWRREEKLEVSKIKLRARGGEDEDKGKRSGALWNLLSHRG